MKITKEIEKQQERLRDLQARKHRIYDIATAVSESALKLQAHRRNQAIVKQVDIDNLADLLVLASVVAPRDGFVNLQRLVGEVRSYWSDFGILPDE